MNTNATLSGEVVANFGLEIGIFAAASIISSFFVLRKIKGNFSNLDAFFASKNWPFLNDDRKLVRYTKILKIITYVLLLIQYAALSLWGGIMIGAAISTGTSTLAGVAVLLVGFAIITFSISVLYIRWSFFKIKILSVIAIAIAFLLYLAFQLYAIFENIPANFLGLSAVFLSLNAIVMILITFLSYSGTKGTILDILDMVKGEKSAVWTKYNDLTLKEQYERLIKDHDYKVSENEIMEHISFIDDRKGFKRSILSGGIQSVLRNQKLGLKSIIFFILYGVAASILIVYAILSAKYCLERNLGWVTAIAIYTTDLIVYLMANTKMSNGPITISITIVGMRCFLLGFGGNYWYIGYCGLYLYLCVIIGWKGITKLLPLELWTGKKKQEKKNIFQKIVRSQWFVFVFANIVFIVITIIVSTVKMDVPTYQITIFNTDYDYWVFGVASILISLTIQSLFLTFRFHQRRNKGIKDKLKFPCCKKWYSTYFLSVFFTYGFAIVVGAIWYSVVKNLFILLTALLIPPVLLSVYIFFINFRDNDYKILADVDLINKRT